ncbi:MAG: hypothetical protein FWG10_02020 [Eubacteriaceae bacterium]|nr:hypothetical protein [Eubacteriaceae bacterium]
MDLASTILNNIAAFIGGGAIALAGFGIFRMHQGKTKSGIALFLIALVVVAFWQTILKEKLGIGFIGNIGRGSTDPPITNNAQIYEFEMDIDSWLGWTALIGSNRYNEQDGLKSTLLIMNLTKG